MTERTGGGRLFRTIRHLTARQIAGRLSLAARRRLYAWWPPAERRGLDGPAALADRGLARVRGWLEVKYPDGLSPRQRELAEGAAELRFTFLHQAEQMRGPGVDWGCAHRSMLWRYQLHYAESVLALALGAVRGEDPGWAERALAQIEDWIGANPPAGHPAWDPYPLSLRVVHWTCAAALLEGRLEAGRRARLAGSLAAQGRYLARHLEWHLGGNHLLKNAKALLVLGTALAGPEAAAWAARGRRLLRGELRAQVLADGGHYERSPLYHGIVFEDLLDVLALTAAEPEPAAGAETREWREMGRRMAAWLGAMRHPDGGLALFNDGAIAGEPGPAELLAYAERLGVGAPPPAGTAALPASGYYVLQRGPGRAIVDCGAIGPDELPAHAHADTLSFELCCSGERTVVDSGTSEYALDDMRRYFRSTAAHNTVRVDEVEQSEVWASHRVGRRARPLGARLEEREDCVSFAGAHDGYARLGVIHHRHVAATGDAWLVVDELRGRGRHRFDSRLHFAPDLALEAAGPGWRVAGPRGAWRVRPFGPLRGEPAQGWYAPDFGRAAPAPVLALRGEAELPVAFGYALTRDDVEAELTAESDDGGVALRGTVAGRPFHLRSERCTSSS